MIDNTTMVSMSVLNWMWPVYGAIMLGFTTWLFWRTQLPGTAILAFGFGFRLLSYAINGISSTVFMLQINASQGAVAEFSAWYMSASFATRSVSTLGHAGILVGFAILCTHLVQQTRGISPRSQSSR